MSCHWHLFLSFFKINIYVFFFIFFLTEVCTSVQFKMVFMRSEKPICVPPRISEVSPTLPLKRFQCSDDSPLSSFQGRSSSASSFNACLRQAINGVMSFALCPLVVSQASQHFRSSEKQTTCEVALPTNVSARSFSFTPACPGQYTHRRFRRWMSALSIPLFTFCSKLTESVRRMACVVI